MFQRSITLFLCLCTVFAGPAVAQSLIFADSFERAGGAFTRAAASRLLHRATFGPTMAEIDRVTRLGAAAWIDEQLTLPVTWTRRGFEPLAQRNLEGCLAEGSTDCEPHLLPGDRYNIWWQTVLEAPDQLRQRVAFALSQILVVSDRGDPLADEVEAMAAYYDLLLTHAFGNYRALLEDVSRSPVMGAYLTHLGNRRAVPELNIRPDENYAREVMQLFTIGLNQLNLDGSQMLDQAGNTIITYRQPDIAAMARVFTGWTFGSISCENFEIPFEIPEELDFIRPMRACSTYHDTQAKTIINGITLPPNQTPEADLGQALDALFSHPNVGPFVTRRLIQRLVTSNPSPAYIARVAGVFNNNGSGVRGDLGAVVKAILLDPEAQAGADANPAFGKLREPLLRLSNLWRTFAGRSASGQFYDYEEPEGQAVLSAPSVFNFFLPDYQPAGLRGSSPSLVAPEFQLASDDKLTANQNAMDYTCRFLIAGAPWAAEDFGPESVLIHPIEELALARDPDALLARIDLLLLGGSMSPGLRGALVSRLAQMTEDSPHERLGEVLAHVFTSPEYLIQR
ncbi:MAG: DUF1800 domain-containing protein [Pseudomonadota bacterium]